MRKKLLLAFAGAALFMGTAAHAQTKTQTVVTAGDNKQVIASIPSLKSISDEITAFESKTAGKKEEYKNAQADLRALKTKYADELQVQIAAHQGNPSVVAALNNELAVTQAEIKQLK